MALDKHGDAEKTQRESPGVVRPAGVAEDTAGAFDIAFWSTHAQ